MGVENVNPYEELNKLDEQISSAAELAALKPIFHRLNEIIQAFPDDFDLQLTGNEVKQRLMERGTQLRQQETSLTPPPAPPEELPPAFGMTSENPPEPAAVFADTSPAPLRPARHRSRIALVTAIAVVLIALALIVVLVRRTGAVQVEIATTPPGALVRVVAEGSAAAGGNEATCTSNCQLALKQGAYQVFATLDGFEPATVTVMARKAAAVALTLQPQAQSVRLLTDLDQGKVVVDDRPPVDLQEGQLVLDKVASGKHTVKVTGQNGDASFSFEIANARMPAVAGPVNARNMLAVLVASFGKHARISTSAGPWKLSVNGRPQNDAGPAGTDLTGFQQGVNEIVVGEGKEQRNMSESFGTAPMLTAFLKTDVNAGTLIVSTGQDDVRVFLNGKEHRRRTQRGQVRIQALGNVTVRVAKSGFQDAPPQSVAVMKGAEVRLQFDLKPQPQFGSLEISGAMPGTDVFVDQKHAGTVGPDGSFAFSGIQPGDRMIDLRREQYLPKRLQRSFSAGQAVTLAGADVLLASATGMIRFLRTPESATVTYRRGDETESHQVRGDQIELPTGSYLFAARAPGFVEATIRVQLTAAEKKEILFNLVRERPAAPTPPPPSGISEFSDPEQWKKTGDSWVRTGGGFVPYKLPPKGTLTFTVELLKGGSVFRAGKIRWCLQYVDSRNYLLYEIDRKSFWAGVIEKGQRFERVKSSHTLDNQKAFTIQIVVTPERLVQQVRVGNEWKVLDNFAEPGRNFTQGKFGFLIQGNDEIAISDFKFQPQ